MTLQDRVAIITGGASGIGRATAELFQAEGAQVVIVDRDGEAVAATARALAGRGAAPMTLVSDVGAKGRADTDAGLVLARFGRIDILLCAAGFSCGGTVLTTEPADWDDVFRVNVGGTWLWARAVIPAMQAAGRGSIIAVASQLAIAGGRGNSAYIAAKGAILALARTMALDFADAGIRVNTLVPGAIETPLLARSFARRPDPAAAREASRVRHPLGRLGRPEEVALAALYLASDASAFTTGTELRVDGGWLAG